MNIKKHIIKILIATGIIGIALAAPKTPEIPSVVVNGQEIVFAYTDENEGEDLIIYTDRETYGGWDKTEIYLAVQNKGKGQVVNLQFYFEDSDKALVNISRLKKNVPYQITINDYETIEYDCSYYSSSTELIKETCEKRELIGTHQETKYRDEWQNQTLEDFSETEYQATIALNDIKVKDKKNHKAEKKIEMPLLKNETAYFKAVITFPQRVEGEFYVECVGNEGGFGVLK